MSAVPLSSYGAGQRARSGGEGGAGKRPDGNNDSTLVHFAQKMWAPMLVVSSGEPSKAGEGKLRDAARTLNLKLSLFRSTSGWAIVEVHPKQTMKKFVE